MMKIVVFDLDDTLYKEVDFLKSAYMEISNRLISHYDLPEDLYNIMMDLYKKS